MNILAPVPRPQFFDTSGNPLSGGKVYTYLAGTTTSLVTYTAFSGGATNSNPIILDSAGMASIWLDDSKQYKFAVHSSSDVLQYTVDYLNSPALSASGGSAGIGFMQAGTGADATTVQSKLREIISVKDFGAVGDGSNNDYSSIQQAIDYAQSLVTTTNDYNDVGVEIYFPTGKYVIDSTLTIAKGGISLCGPLGRGAMLTGDVILVKCVGTSPSFISFQNLNFYSSSSTNSTAAVELNETVWARFNRCLFVRFNIGIDCYRARETLITGCRFDNGNRTTQALACIRMQGTAGGAGGGMHISDCEFAGAKDTDIVDTTSGVLINAVDGFYMTQSHFANCVRSIELAPDASLENHHVTDVMCENCYFDESSKRESAHGITPFNVLIGGTVKFTDPGVQSFYRSVRMSNCYFRGGGPLVQDGPFPAKNNVRIEVTDGGGWNDSENDKRFEDILFSNCSFRQSEESGIRSVGTTGKIEPFNLIIDGCSFDENNKSGSDPAAAIYASVESSVITSNAIKREGIASTTNYAIHITLTDASTVDFPTPASVIVNNDCSKAISSIEPIRVGVTNSAGSNYIQGSNLYPGAGRHINQQYKLKTIATTAIDIWSFDIPEKVAGQCTLIISGSNSDGSKAVAYEFYAGFRRSSTTSELSSGSSSFSLNRAWRSPGTLPAPTATLATNTLKATIIPESTAEWTWSCYVQLAACK